MKKVKNYLQKASVISGMILLLGLSACIDRYSALCERSRFNEGWYFLRTGQADSLMPPATDAAWREIVLPHDWSVEALEPGEGISGPFSKTSVGGSATGNTVGGTGWYRKIIGPADPDKIYRLYFEGVYMESELRINGKKAGGQPYGYTSWYCDLTSYLSTDHENEILLRAVNRGKNSRWYAGSGIYRNVWMVETGRVRLSDFGVQISTLKVENGDAEIEISSNILNEGRTKSGAKVTVTVFDPLGHIVGKAMNRVSLGPDSALTLHHHIKIPGAQLWSVDEPELYRLMITVNSGSHMSDKASIPFGIRTLDWSAEKGFLLNGETIELRGGCVHHDNGLLGAAAIDRAEERKVELMKANGFNAVRCSHNPPSETFLNTCDRLGMLVIDEIFDQWQKGKNPDDYHRFFNEWHEKDISSMVLRDRNHPSVIMWSIGNEIPERADSSGMSIALALREIILIYDTTRPVTAAVNTFWDNPGLTWKDSERAFAALDISGYNYAWWEYGNDHRLFPGRVLYGSESVPLERAVNWDLVRKYPWVCGDFVWTAMDYLGEAGIGHAIPVKTGLPDPPLMQEWPWYNGWCGDIDLLGNRKPQALIRDVVWERSRIEMSVHVPLPAGYTERISYWGWPDEIQSWTWPGFENKAMEVRVFTRYPAVRIFVNDLFVTEKQTDTAGVGKYTAVFSVPYYPGELRATAVENGEERESCIIQTTGEPAKIVLQPDCSKLSSNPNDLLYVMISLADENDREVNYMDIPLRIAVDGPATIAGSGNASPTDMKSFRSLHPSTFRGKAMVILRPTGETGNIVLTVTAENGTVEGALLEIEAGSGELTDERYLKN